MPTQKKDAIKKRRFMGVIVSTKMEGSVVVKVSRTVTHPKYGKKYTKTRLYHSHEGQFQLHEGDKVIIEECRPLSKTKRWRVIEKLSP